MDGWITRQLITENNQIDSNGIFSDSKQLKNDMRDYIPIYCIKCMAVSFYRFGRILEAV